MVGRSNTIRELFVYRSVTRRTTRARGRCKGSKKRTCERLPRLLSARRRCLLLSVKPLLRHGTELSRCSDSHLTGGQGKVTEQPGSSAHDDPEPIGIERRTCRSVRHVLGGRSDQFSYCRSRGASRR